MRSCFLVLVPSLRIFMFTFFLAGFITLTFADVYKNIVTIKNPSDESALVKLAGPVTESINVRPQQEGSVTVPPGKYAVLIRYGTNSFRYSQGDSISVVQTSNQASAITIVLTQIANGNYRTSASSKESFEQPSINSETSQTNNTLKSVNSNGDSLIVISVPLGYKTYIVPETEMHGDNMDVVTSTSDKFLKGKTPLRISLIPGKYIITLVDYDNPIDAHKDGEKWIISALAKDGSALLPVGKSYEFTKKADTAGIFTGLFWNKKQALSDFVKSQLPSKKLFNIPPIEGYANNFNEHGIPQNDRKYLYDMICKTGKCIWYNSIDSSDYFLMYWRTIDNKGKPQVLITQPVK